MALTLSEFKKIPVDTSTPTKKAQNFELFNPQPKNSKSGVYTAVVRFLPNIDSPNDFLLNSFKTLTYFANVDGKFNAYKCPSMIGENQGLVGKTWWDYKNKTTKGKEDVKASAILKNFSQAKYYYSLVYVLKDLAVPENDGKIMVYRYPQTIKNRIDEQRTPSSDKLELGIEPCDVLNLMEGKNFTIEVSKKGENPNYDNCIFDAQPSPFALNLKTQKTNNFSNDDSVGEILLNGIEANPERNILGKIGLNAHPKVSDLFGYTKASDEDYNRFVEKIAYITGESVETLKVNTESEQAKSRVSVSLPTVENTVIKASRKTVSDHDDYDNDPDSISVKRDIDEFIEAN